jgi:hypothetical protein
MQTRGSELCLAIVGRLRVRSFLSEGMHITALHHTGMAEQLAMLQAAVSSAAEFMLRHSPFETFWVEVVDEMFAEFQKQKEWRSCHETRCVGLQPDPWTASLD